MTPQEIKNKLLEIRENALNIIDQHYYNYLDFVDSENVGFILLEQVTELINNIKGND